MPDRGGPLEQWWCWVYCHRHAANCRDHLSARVPPFASSSPLWPLTTQAAKLAGPALRKKEAGPPAGPLSFNITVDATATAAAAAATIPSMSMASLPGASPIMPPPTLGPGGAPAVPLPLPGLLSSVGAPLEVGTSVAASLRLGEEGQQAALLGLIQRMNSEQLGVGGKASLAATVAAASPSKAPASGQDGNGFAVPLPRMPSTAAATASPSGGVGLQALFGAEPSPAAAALDSLLGDVSLASGLSTDFGGSVMQQAHPQQNIATRRSKR